MLPIELFTEWSLEIIFEAINHCLFSILLGGHSVSLTQDSRLLDLDSDPLYDHIFLMAKVSCTWCAIWSLTVPFVNTPTIANGPLFFASNLVGSYSTTITLSPMEY